MSAGCLASSSYLREKVTRSKRPNRQGTISKRTDGRWMVRVVRDGKRRWAYAYSPEEAEELRQRMATGVRLELSGKTLESIRTELEKIEEAVDRSPAIETAQRQLFHKLIGWVRDLLASAIRERNLARRQAERVAATLRRLRETEELALTGAEGALAEWEAAMQEADRMLELSFS